MGYNKKRQNAGLGNYGGKVMSDGLANVKKIQLEFGKASPLVKTVISAAIGLSAMALISLRIAQWDAEASTERLLERAAVLQRENTQLQEMVDELDTVSGIRRIAAEELGLVDPSTVIFDSE